MSRLNKLKEENEALKKEFEQLRSENEKLSEQMNWSESTTSNHAMETKLTVGQEKVYSSSVETMRAVFSNFDLESDGLIEIESVPSLHHRLGEMITEEEGNLVVEELKKIVPNGRMSFEDFLEWWINKYKKKNQQSRFKLISLNLSKKGELKLNRIKKREVGRVGTLSYRIRYFYKDDNYMEHPISPWHDVPLYRVGYGMQAKLVSFICEIPKWTRAKYEIATREKFNPIKQDIKFGKLRYYKHGDLMFNYGLLPQTWEDPNHISKDTKKRGDNDPIDAIEIGTRQREVGEIVVVKILGVIGLIDSDETDWKIITIAIDDPLSQNIHDIDDVEIYVPGCITAIREYFRDYKKKTAKKENEFAFGELPKGREYALNIVLQTHNFWKKLREGNKDGVVPK